MDHFSFETAERFSCLILEFSPSITCTHVTKPMVSHHISELNKARAHYLIFNYFIVFWKVKTDSVFHTFLVANKITKQNEIHKNGLDHLPGKSHTNATIKYFQKTCPNINKTVNLNISLKKRKKKKQNFFLGLGRTGRNRKFLKLIY